MTSRENTYPCMDPASLLRTIFIKGFPQLLMAYLMALIRLYSECDCERERGMCSVCLFVGLCVCVKERER